MRTRRNRARGGISRRMEIGGGHLISPWAAVNQWERPGSPPNAPSTHPAIRNTCDAEKSSGPYPAMTADKPPGWTAQIATYTSVAVTPRSAPCRARLEPTFRSIQAAIATPPTKHPTGTAMKKTVKSVAPGAPGIPAVSPIGTSTRKRRSSRRNAPPRMRPQ